MAGINRLGKAPPKPGTLRPPDPNKYRTLDVYSEGGEGDMEYMRMVRDIEDMQQQQGWLFGRGAFDKADLLYLRDTAEQQRHLENELRDRELMQFAALKAEVDHAHEDRRPPSTSTNAKGKASKKPPLVKICRVVKGKPPDDESEPDNKRLKTEHDTQDKVLVQNAAATSGIASAAAPECDSKDKESKLDMDSASNMDNEDDAGLGLLGLLPDYGSDSEETGAEEDEVQTVVESEPTTNEQIDRG